MDEVALKRAVHKGEQARKLIEANKPLWEDIEAEIWRMWQDSGSADKEGREDLYREQHAIKAVQGRLRRIVDQGKRAEEELKHQKVKDGKRNPA